MALPVIADLVVLRGHHYLRRPQLTLIPRIPHPWHFFPVFFGEGTSFLDAGTPLDGFFFHLSFFF